MSAAAIAPPETELPEPLAKLLANQPRFQWPIWFGWHLSQRWGADACPLMAAAMAFFGLLSVFPITLAVLAILARLLAGDSEALQSFARYIADFFPGAAGQQIQSEIERSVQAMAGNNNATVGLVAVASLLWSGRAFFDTLSTVLNRIWPGAQQRSFWMHQVVLWSLIVGAGLLWGLSTGATFALSLLRSLGERFPQLFINDNPLFWDVLAKVVSWFLTVAMFWLIYRFLPHRVVPSRQRVVWGAAIFAALGWEALKWAFTGFLGNVSRYEVAYGGVAGIVVTMMWIYFSSLILLLGAEGAAAYEAARREIKGE